MKRFGLCFLLTFVAYISKAQRSEINRRLVEDSASWYRYYFPDAVDSVLAKHIRYNSKLYLDTINDYKQNYYLVLNKANNSTWQLQIRYSSNVLLSPSLAEKLLKTVTRYTVIEGLKIPVLSTEDYQFGRNWERTDHDMTVTFTIGRVLSVSPYSGF
jgi:hypothetical protein